MPEPLRFPTLADNWGHFKNVDIAPEAPQIQRDEMERAFYAGASSAMMICSEANASGMLWEKLAVLLAELRAWKAMRQAYYRSRGVG